MSSYGGGFGRGSSRRAPARGRQVFAGRSSGRGERGARAPQQGRGGGRTSSAGHWFDGRWYPASSGRASSPSRGQGSRDQRSMFEPGRQPRDYYPAEGDFDAGEGDYGLARRVGFRF